MGITNKTKYIQENKEQIISWYLDDNLSSLEIGRLLNLDRSCISANLRKWGITKSKELLKQQKVQSITKYDFNYDTLYDLYIVQDKTSTEIANIYGCNRGTVSSILRKFELHKDRANINLKNLEKARANFKPNNEKRKQTCLRKYGYESSNQVPEIKEKQKQSCLKRYGVEKPLQSPEIYSKLKITTKKKYGVEFASKTPEFKEQVRNTNINKYGKAYFTQTQEFLDKVTNTNMTRYNIPFACMRPECRKGCLGIISKVNYMWVSSLESLGNKVSLEFPLGKKSYDLRVNKILLEINPTITHNVSYNPFSSKNIISPDYHLQKSRLATENGYHCIHVWDWDDKDKILNLFKQKERIPARKCKVEIITSKEADKFNNLYHLQNTCRGQDIIYGLYYNEELVSLMSFGKPRYNKNYQWELLRYTTHPNYIVIGGAEKLFKHFIQDFTPESIISYCDYSKFSGQVYEKLGFNKIRHTSPACHWVKGNKRITQAQLNKYGFDKLFGSEYGYYGKGTNNQELMLQHGFVQVYDCGQMVFVYTSS